MIANFFDFLRFSGDSARRFVLEDMIGRERRDSRDDEGEKKDGAVGVCAARSKLNLLPTTIIA